jgi:hypothetical protein
VSNQKYFLIPTLHSPSYKCSNVLVVISQNSVTKRGLSCIEKREREKGLVSKRKKKKKREKVYEQPKFSQKFLISKREVSFQGARVELCF